MMRREELLRDVLVVEARMPEVVDYSGIEFDSRKVRAGAIFVALSGYRVDGHEHVADAVASGASLLVVSRREYVPAGKDFILVEDTRLSMAYLSRNLLGHPSGAMHVVGVTGTNGKTSITYILEHVSRECGLLSGLVGTMGARFAGESVSLANTTPESADLLKLLASMRRKNVELAALEVSSHGIAFNRVAGIDFAVGVFTNLSQDHLDFHGTMEEYGATKRRLFTELLPASPSCRGAVLNLDDELGRSISEAIGYRQVRYSLERALGDLWPEQLELGFGGMTFDAVGPFGRVPVRSRLVGRHNVANILAALGAVHLLDLDVGKAAAALDGMAPVRGRLDQIENELGIGLWVDYAHSPDSLEKVLATLREVVPGRLFTVFGAGGDRDRTKRPIMGSVVERLSDLAIITSDNPRTESPLSIIADIQGGISPDSQFSRTLIIPDRAMAIEAAISLARSGDGVLIAGKGHETYQIIGTEVLHFDDSEVACGVCRSLEVSK